MDTIEAEDYGVLNEIAMFYFVKRDMFLEAAVCRDRVKQWSDHLTFVRPKIFKPLS